jgi:hypothetical protein
VFVTNAPSISDRLIELPLGAVGAVDDHLFGLILFADGQVGAPTTRLSSVLVGFALGSRRPIAESPGPVNRKEIKSKV